MFGLSSKTKERGNECRFAFSDIAFTAAEEDVDVGVFVAPGVRGAFKHIMTRRISIEKGSLSFDREITMETEIFAFKPQSRIIRTEDLSEQEPSQPSGSCPVESNKNDDNEESFQMLIVGHGPATLRWIRSFAILAPEEDYAGSQEACQNEDEFNTTRFDGESVFNPDLNEAAAELAAKPIPVYYSTKTASVSQNGISAVGVGSAESIVDQDAADRVAERIAIRMAEVEIAAVSPKFLSLGEGF